MAKRQPRACPEARRVQGLVSGQRAKSRVGCTVLSHTVGAIPLLMRIMERMQLEPLLRQHVPDKDSSTKPATARVLTVLVCNLLVSREPVYGVAKWAGNYAPDLFELQPDELPHLNDDRVGRCLDRLFAALDSELVLAVVRQVVQEFGVQLEELHNDSTTISFFGTYADAQQEGLMQQLATPAVSVSPTRWRRLFKVNGKFPCCRMMNLPRRWSVPAKNATVEKFRSAIHRSFGATVSNRSGSRDRS